MKKRAKKYWIWFAFLALLILGVLFPLRKAVNSYTDQVVRLNLSKMIVESSKEKYILDYDKLRFNIFTQHISLSNFRIYPVDTNRYLDQVQVSTPPFYAVNVERVDLQLEKEWEIFLNKKLLIKELKITSPKVKIHQLRTDTQKIKFAKISGDIYQLVTQYLSLLKLKTFSVKDAIIDYSIEQGFKVQHFNFDPISFKLTNFRVKEGAQESSNIFFTDDFELNSGKQEFTLPDSSHVVSFDRFKITTVKNQIEFYNLRVTSILPDTTTRNHLTLFVPTLKLKSVDFERAYLKNEYLVKNLKIERPAIKFVVNKPQSKHTPEQIDELEKWLELIEVNSTIISQGNVSVNDNRGQYKKTYLVNGFSLKIAGAHVDTNILDRIVLEDLQKNYRFSIRELKHQIPEEELLIKVNDIAYSSITQLFKCNEIAISPNELKLKKKMANANQLYHLENLQLAGVAISDLDLNKLSEGRKTVLGRVVLKSPVLALSCDTSDKIKPDSLVVKNTNLPYELDSLSTKLLKIINAKVSFTNSRDESIKYGTFSQANISAVNLNWKELNSRDEIAQTLLTKTAIESGKSEFINPKTKDKVSWNSLSADPISKTFVISNLAVTPSSKKTNNLKLGLLRMKGLNYDQVLLNSVLVAKSLELKDVDLNLVEENQKEKGLRLNMVRFETVDVKNLNLKRSKGDTVNLRLKGVELIGTQVKMVKDSASNTPSISYGTIEASIDGLMTVNKSRNSTTTTQKVKFNSIDSILEITNLRKDPIIENTKKSDPVFQQRIANVYATGFNPNNQQLGKSFSARHLEICSPITNYSFFTSSNKKSSNQKTNNDMIQLQKWFFDSTQINQLNYQTLAVDNGSLSIVWKENPGQKREERLEVSQYSVQSTGFDFNKTTKNKDSRFYYAKDHTIRLFNVKRQFADSINDLNIEHVEYSTGSKNTKLLGVSGSYMLKENGASKLFVEGAVDLVEFDGIQPIKITKEKSIDLKGIYAVNPRLEFTQFHNNVDKVSRELSLQKKGNDSTAISKTLLKSLKIKNGFIKWDFNDTSAKPLVINHLNFDGSGFEFPNPDTTQKAPQIIDLAFSFGDFQYDVLKNFYNISFDSVNYDSKTEELSLDKIKLDPKYGIFEFGQQAGWQKGRLEMFVSSVNMKGFKGKQLLYENKLSISLLDIDSLWVRNFKDKRLPLKERYIPMPQERLDNLNMGLNIKRVVLRKGDVTHIQIAKNGVVPGKIYFTDLSARASNITNTYEDQKEAKTTRVTALGKLMGDGQMSATFEFNNKEPNNYFEGHASLGEFDARTLNNYLMHTAFVGVKSGKVIDAGIDFKAYNDFGTGDMKLLYNDLHVTFLNKNDTMRKGLGMAMKGFIANRVVYTKNPHFFITKKGLIYTQRDTTKEIFHYWSKLAMSGVASSTGVKNNKKELKKVRKEALRREKAILRDEDELLEKSTDQPYGGKGD